MEVRSLASSSLFLGIKDSLTLLWFQLERWARRQEGLEVLHTLEHLPQKQFLDRSQSSSWTSSPLEVLEPSGSLSTPSSSTLPGLASLEGSNKLLPDDVSASALDPDSLGSCITRTSSFTLFLLEGSPPRSIGFHPLLQSHPQIQSFS